MRSLFLISLGGLAVFPFGCSSEVGAAYQADGSASSSSNAAAPSLTTPWHYFPVSANGPTLALIMPPSIPSFVVSCNDVTMKFHVRGFKPEQRWPQPEMTVQFGPASRAKVPDLRLIGQQTAFEIDVPVQDSMLAPIRAGAQFSARFADQRLLFPTPPDDMRFAFVRACEKPLPPAMRAG